MVDERKRNTDTPGADGNKKECLPPLHLDLFLSIFFVFQNFASQILIPPLPPFYTQCGSKTITAPSPWVGIPCCLSLLSTKHNVLLLLLLSPRFLVFLLFVRPIRLFVDRFLHYSNLSTLYCPGKTRERPHKGGYFLRTKAVEE